MYKINKLRGEKLGVCTIISTKKASGGALYLESQRRKIERF